jgi:hypothetical protein
MLTVLKNEYVPFEDGSIEQSCTCEYFSARIGIGALNGASDRGARGDGRASSARCRCYRQTCLADLRPDQQAFFKEAYAPALHAMVARVVAQEGPIRDRILVERIARAHGIGRSDEAVRRRILSQARWTAWLQPDPWGGVFAWPLETSPGAWRIARPPASPADLRRVEDIALEELAAALRGAKGEDPEVQAARFFGVQRLSTAGRARMNAARRIGA